MKYFLALFLASCASSPITKEADEIIHPAPDMDAGLIQSDKPMPVPTLLPADPTPTPTPAVVVAPPAPVKAVVKPKAKKKKK